MIRIDRSQLTRAKIWTRRTMFRFRFRPENGPENATHDEFERSLGPKQQV